MRFPVMQWHFLGAMPGLQHLRELPLVKQLEAAEWRVWLLKGRTPQAWSRVPWMQFVTRISLAGLVLAASAGPWFHLSVYDVVVRCVVAAAAIALTFQATPVPGYATAGGFGAAQAQPGSGA